MAQSSTVSNPIQLAIVSPCSRCQNQYSVPTNGHPPCPRRQLQQRQAELVRAGVDTRHLDHLVLTGREFATQTSGSSGDNDLRNPVYWNEGQAVLVWVATLAANGGLRGADGTLVTPHLVDPAFDTAYIQCHPLPVVPAVAESTYFANGAFMEGDQLEVRFSANQQLDRTPLEPNDPGTVLIDGFAQKVNFLFLTRRRAVEKDHTSPLT